MRLELIGEDEYRIFINNLYIDDIDFNDKEEIVSLVKDFILKTRDLYSIYMKGFYKVRVYPHKNIGLFLEMEKIDDIPYGKGIDLRIVVFLEEKFFLKFSDYDYLPENVDSIFYQNNYYVNLEDLKKNIISYLELGEVVYGDEIFFKLKTGSLVKRKNTEVFKLQ